jgi:hypothetical protein
MIACGRLNVLLEMKGSVYRKERGKYRRGRKKGWRMLAAGGGCGRYIAQVLLLYSEG